LQPLRHFSILNVNRKQFQALRLLVDQSDIIN
jgi:hypothetical protein